MSHKFTIIVPSRDRLENLKITCEHLLKIKHPSFCILISDNCSTDGTYEYIDQTYGENENIKLIQTPERLPMSLNWDFAIRHVKSEFYTIIGDDDGIYHNALEIVEDIFMDNPEIDFIRSNVSSFHWPTEECKGSFSGSKRKKTKYSVLSTKSSLSACKIGAVPYTYLPMLYNGGFVRTKVINDYLKTNPDQYFYKSINPDIYSAVYFGLNLDKYIYVHRDLAINGASKYSTGVSTFTIGSGEKKSATIKSMDENKSKGFRAHSAIPNSSLGEFVPAGAYFVHESYFQNFGKNYRPNYEEVQELIFSCRKTSSPEYAQYLNEWIDEISSVYSLEKLSYAHKIRLEATWLSYKLKRITKRIQNRLSRFTLHADSIEDALHQLEIKKE
ncbi:glycosyltransferase family 2 protein [Amylibacter sp.]|nr:glycosyltransferase family 2 protein [Amylibacter sp.]